MNTPHLRVLIVEDNPTDAELLELALSRGGYAPSVTRVQTSAEMEGALERADWDLILSDYVLPKFSGLEALELLKSSGKDIPFILVSGSAGDDVAITAMRAGAQDFFTKGTLALLVSAIQREVREAALRAVARAQREQLQHNEKLAALGTLLAGVSHELNNPLSLIMHQATLLMAESEGSPQQVRARSILQAVRSCSGIVKNFLALARQEPQRRVSFSVNAVIRDAIDLLSHGLVSDGISVELSLTEALPPVSGDPQQMERVVINLVRNAQYALRSRPGPRTVRILSSTENEQVHLSIEDNGGGLPAEIRTRIFDPFFTTKPVGEGTGLGLSVCHAIITAHNGTITAGSEADHGTIFRITLPVDSTPIDHQIAPVSIPRSSQQLRILVVDDNDEVAKAFSEILTTQGHLVDIASTSRAALEQVASGAYAVVMTDVKMPDLDGPALFREVTRHYPLLKHSFLFVTGDTFSRETDRFLKETGSVYLSKPCSFEEVEAAVALVMRKRQGEVAPDEGNQ